MFYTQLGEPLHMLFTKQQVRLPEDNRIHQMFTNLNVEQEERRGRGGGNQKPSPILLFNKSRQRRL